MFHVGGLCYSVNDVGEKKELRLLLIEIQPTTFPTTFVVRSAF